MPAAPRSRSTLPVPKFDFRRLNARLGKLLLCLPSPTPQLQQLPGLTAAELETFSREAARILFPYSTAEQGLVRSLILESARHLAEPHSPQAAEQLCRRLICSDRTLLRGIPTYPWAAQTEPEWCPVHIIAVGLFEDQKSVFLGDQLLTFTGQVLFGSPAGLTTQKRLSRRQLAYLARQAGFSRQRIGDKMCSPLPKLPRYEKPEQFVGLRWLGLFEPDRSNPGRPGYGEILCSNALAQYNRSVLRSAMKGFLHAK